MDAQRAATIGEPISTEPPRDGRAPTVAVRPAVASEPPVVHERRSPTSRVLRWFGVELHGAAGLPLDEARTCLTPGCRRHALVGELLCPVHLDVAHPEEMPDFVTQAATRPRRAARAIAFGALLGLSGVVIGTIVGEPRFGWLGALAAGSTLASFVAREAGFRGFAGLAGLAGFFAAATLLFAGLFVGAIAALPLLLP